MRVEETALGMTIECLIVQWLSLGETKVATPRGVGSMLLLLSLIVLLKWML